MIPTGEVELSRPGAGLPLVERLFTRYFLVRRVAPRTPWNKSVIHYRREGERLLALAAGLSREQLTQRVLVDRIPGMEDSSRYWSVAMTLEHLMTVGRGMSSIVLELTHGRLPTIKVDIAAVKPRGLDDPDTAVSVFRAFLDQMERKMTDETGNRISKLTHPHPWFGSLTAHQWNYLLASHQAVHRRQVELIRKALVPTGLVAEVPRLSDPGSVTAQ